MLKERLFMGKRATSSNIGFLFTSNKDLNNNILITIGIGCMVKSVFHTFLTILIACASYFLIFRQERSIQSKDSTAQAEPLLTQEKESTMSLSLLKVAAPANPSATMIIVHGLGDSGSGWKFLSELFHQQPQFQHINFIFPNAPVKPLTVQGGRPAAQWFDIYEFGNPNSRQDVEGFFTSVGQMKELIKKEIASGIPADRIILGGFSQGAAISLATAATLDVKIGGVLGLSGFCPVRAQVEEQVSDANKETPFLQCHGDKDPIISFSYAKLTYDFYKSLGFKNYEFKEYAGMGHSTCNDEMKHIVQFVQKVLPSK